MNDAPGQRYQQRVKEKKEDIMPCVTRNEINEDKPRESNGIYALFLIEHHLMMLCVLKIFIVYTSLVGSDNILSFIRNRMKKVNEQDKLLENLERNEEAYTYRRHSFSDGVNPDFSLRQILHVHMIMFAMNRDISLHHF